MVRCSEGRANVFGNQLIRKDLVRGEKADNSKATILPDVKRAATTSKKARREWENKKVIGGMRNPNRPCDFLPSLRSVGAKLKEAFAKFAETCPEVFKVGELYGRKDYSGPPTRLVENFRSLLRDELGAEPEPTQEGVWGQPSTPVPTGSTHTEMLGPCR